jgi:hypothetical protein
VTRSRDSAQQPGSVVSELASRSGIDGKREGAWGADCMNHLAGPWLLLGESGSGYIAYMDPGNYMAAADLEFNND